MLHETSNLYSLTELDITVYKQPAAVLTDLTVATSLHGGNASQEICRIQTTETGCNAHPECQWNTGDCNDKGTGDWDQ